MSQPVRTRVGPPPVTLRRPVRAAWPVRAGKTELFAQYRIKLVRVHDGGVVDVSSNPLVVDIARRLVADGRFVTQLRTDNLQSVVDVGWAARQAGQLLGRPVRVETTRGEEPGSGLTVTAEFADALN